MKTAVYIELIGRLLAATSQEELQEILQQQKDLIDEGFFTIGQHLAEQMEADGEQEKATLLVNLLEYIAIAKKNHQFCRNLVFSHDTDIATNRKETFK